MVLSGNGISFAAEKVETVTGARESQNASETRSFPWKSKLWVVHSQPGNNLEAIEAFDKSGDTVCVW